MSGNLWMFSDMLDDEDSRRNIVHDLLCVLMMYRRIKDDSFFH